MRYKKLFTHVESHASAVSLHEWIAFYSAFLNIHRSGVLTVLAWLVPQESAARESQSRRVLCTPYNHAPCHFMQSHIRKVYACLAVTCHLRFWQNDRGLLHATAVTRGWNGYRNKSQHRKLTLEKKILPPLQQGLEPVTFRSRVWCSNHWAIPAPLLAAENTDSCYPSDLLSKNTMTMSHLSCGNFTGSLQQNTLSLNRQLFHCGTLTALCYLSSPAVCPHTHFQISSSFLSKTSDCSRCQPERCWCKILSVSGSRFLEFDATKYLPHLLFVIF